ncbi:MAG: phosphoribosylanthranilate isomerase [Ponticaulis sp.]|nr:phosphoribosylanthranilate isomerase [Ponticaulis sp.]
MTTKPTDIKICGLKTEADVRAAVEAGARWLGFVHFEKSPRHVSIETGEALIAAAREVSTEVETVVLLVNPETDMAVELAERWDVDHIQLHGQETNMQIQTIRTARGRGEVWKALPVSEADDLNAVKLYPAADRFLFDAKPPKDASRPGGWGHSFDWTLLKGFRCDRPWLLAGGLSPENVAEAVRISGAKAVDVSSGVEAEKGVKDAAKIASFCAAVRG